MIRLRRSSDSECCICVCWLGSTAVRSLRSDDRRCSENYRFHLRDVSSETCKERSSEGVSECSFGDVVDSRSGKRRGLCTRDCLNDFVSVFVLCLCFVVYLVGKILLFIHDEISSSGEKIGASGVVEEERWDIGNVGLCSTGEFDVSGIVSIDSGLEGSIGINSLDKR